MRYIAVFVIVIFVLHLLHTDSSEQRLVRYSHDVAIDTSVVHTWLRLLESKGVKFPMVALAQATWETDYFHSTICKENKNLFGMKYNTRGLAIGKNRGHALYDDGKKSIADYAAWQKKMLTLRPCKTEEEYIRMLDSLPTSSKTHVLRYAEDPEYTTHIRQRIKELRSLQ